MNDAPVPRLLDAVRNKRHYADALTAPATLLVRLAIGVMFAQAGWGKFTHLERTAGYFESLGIPAADLHALLVANVEFFGGCFLVLGLLTRIWAVPLSITMVVAIVTALLPDVDGFLGFLTLDEFLYLSVLISFVAQGAGKWSLDQLLDHSFSGWSRRASSARETSQTTHTRNHAA